MSEPVGTMVGETRAFAPTPDGGGLTVEVECRLSRTAVAGPRHTIEISPDWTLKVPHDLEAERVAAAFGGYVSCLELPAAVEACRGSLDLLARRRRVDLTRSPGHGWRLRQTVKGCPCSWRKFTEAKYAAMHARSPLHIASRAGVPEFLVSAVLEALRLAYDEFRPPPKEWQAAKRWVREPTGLNDLWAIGLSTHFVMETVRDLELKEPHPVRFYLGLEFRDVDRDWLREVLRNCPDPDVATWLATRTLGLEGRDPAMFGHWLAQGIGRLDAEILTRSDSAHGYVMAVSAELSWPIRTAGTVIAAWEKVDCRPSPFDFRLLETLGIDTSYRPSGPAIDTLASHLSGVDRPPSRTHLGVMLAMAGSVHAARDAVLAGARTPADLAQLIIEGDA